MTIEFAICQVIVHDLQTGEPLDWLPHEEPVYGLSVHPSQVFKLLYFGCNICKDKHYFLLMQPDTVLTACSDGRILCHDLRGGSSSESMLAGSFSP